MGKIPNEVFRKLSDHYLLEQKEIQSSIPKREERLEKLKDSVANVGAFLEKAKHYTQLDTLTAEILNLFIERVEVGEREERYSRTAPQSIDIYYRRIGLLDNIVETEAITEQGSIPQEVASKSNRQTAKMHCLPIDASSIAAFQIFPYGSVAKNAEPFNRFNS